MNPSMMNPQAWVEVTPDSVNSVSNRNSVSYTLVAKQFEVEINPRYVKGHAGGSENISDTTLLIYGLIDPQSKEIRYIGLSTKGLKRPQRHLTPSGRKGNTHRDKWLRALSKNNLYPEILILQKCSSVAELSDAEKCWIAKYKNNGAKLTNLMTGGYPSNDEVMNFKRREALVGRKKTLEHAAKIAKALIGNKNSIGNTNNLGRKWSAEVRAKMGEAKKGRKATEETKKKMSLASLKANPGKPVIDNFGNVYKNSKEAGKAVNRSQAAIHKVTSGKHLTCAGRTFKYLEVGAEKCP